MVHLKPCEIRYSQDSISNTFDSRSSHSNVHIGETLDDLIEGRIDVHDIPEISVQKMGDKWISADNRRLWVFKHLEKFTKCETIPCTVVYIIPPAKRSSTNDGMSVKIRGGGNPGGRYFFLLPVFETFLKDYETERQELKKRNEGNENDLHYYKTLVGQLYSKIRKLQSEEKDEQTNLEIIKKLHRSREINQKYKEVNSQQSAKIDVLNEKLKKTLNTLSKVEENAFQNDESLFRSRTTTKKLEDKVSELELKLFDSRENSRKLKEAYKNMEAAYKEKIRGLENVTETLRHSQSATEIAKNETRIRSMNTELERMNKNYLRLKRIHTNDTLTIETLRKEIETIKQDNDKLKQDIENKDKGMMEIRKLTEMYGPV